MAAASQAIDICALSWGDKSGYVVLSLRNPNLSNNDTGYWTDHPFRWPDERDKIEQFIARKAHGPRDLYWAPAVFRTPRRDETKVKRLDTLFADLDEVNPDKLPQYLQPTASWETSPGRYQALWSVNEQLTPALHREINQRLTYAIGADKGGWGLTKVLRLPGTTNHKYDDRPEVRLVHLNGHVLDAQKVLNDLPEVSKNGLQRHAVRGGTDTLDQGDLPSPRAVLQAHRIPARARRILSSRHVVAHTRSERLWELECLLAESGLTAPEIVALVRASVWNKFKGRADELRRLLTEAEKAIEHSAPVVEPVEEAIEPQVDEAALKTWLDFDRQRKPISWLIAEVWGESEVGFISGPPKTFKSWISLDMAISVATGTAFLNYYQTRKRNVLLIQEEDPQAVLQTRMSQIAGSKDLIYARPNGSSILEMQYDLPDNLFVISNQGFTVNEEWLDQMYQWIHDREIGLVVMDPLSMIAGEVDEFKMFELMTKLLKPLKILRQETQTAIAIVHHHTKNDQGKTGGGAMYGSVAFWAWEESAMHLSLLGQDRVRAERFSKHDQLTPITIDLGNTKELWDPQITKGSSGSFEDMMASMETATIDEASNFTSMGRETMKRYFDKLEIEGKVRKTKEPSTGRGRPAYRYHWNREG